MRRRRAARPTTAATVPGRGGVARPRVAPARLGPYRLLEVLGEETGAFIVDERAAFRPAGLARFARSRGGHLEDDPGKERVLTIQQLESLVMEPRPK